MERNHAPQPTDWNSTLYDRQLGFVSAYGMGAVDWLAPRPGEHVLDLGCGTGDLTAQIAAKGAAADGLDASEAMILEARRKYPGLHFEVADAHGFRPAHTYDAVFSNAALHWMTRPAAVIRGVAAALRHGGRFVGEFGARGNVERIVHSLEQAVGRLGIDAAARNPWFFPSAGEYATLLEAEGFTVRRLVTFERPTPLNDGDHGLRHWLTMFGGAYWSGLTAVQVEAVIADVGQALRAELYADGVWTVDYVRLRFEAVKSM